MLYLIRPNAAAQWSDLPTSMLDKLPPGMDLARLEWQPSERLFDDVVLSLALRYGHACSAGIVLDAGIVSERTWAGEIRTAHAGVVASRQSLRNQDAFMDRLIPGWSAHGEGLNTKVDESSVGAAEAADEQLLDLLNAQAVQAELVELWTLLGGRLPRV